MLTNVPTSAATAASSTARVPHTLVLSASTGCDSSSGRWLERRGVEHDVGPALTEQAPHALAVTDVEQHEVGGVEQRASFERELHGMERRTRRGRS